MSMRIVLIRLKEIVRGCLELSLLYAIVGLGREHRKGGEKGQDTHVS